MISVLDSYYSFVKTQMGTVDTTQTFGGIVNARDWPQTQPVEGALYLLFIQAVPSPAIRSTAQVLYEFICQWNWYLIGTDIQPNREAANRGDRYRSTMQVSKNLRNANFPNFCQKYDFSVSPSGAMITTPSASTYPDSPMESIWWTPVRVATRADNEKSGLTYGIGAVSVYGFEDVDADLVGL
jgi:hypothetical protein